MIAYRRAEKTTPLEWGEDREAAYNQVISQAGASLLPQQQPGQPQQQVKTTGQPLPAGTPRPQQATARPAVKRPPAAPGVTPTAQTATGPNGQKLMKGADGRWYPM
jgi:hypothetical protein